MVKIKYRVAKVATLLQENQDQLDTFLTMHPIGQKLPTYFKQLAEYLQNEWVYSKNELEALNNKVMHIKAIVTMQQSLSVLPLELKRFKSIN